MRIQEKRVFTSKYVEVTLVPCIALGIGLNKYHFHTRINIVLVFVSIEIKW